MCGTPEEGDLCAVCRWRMRGEPVLGELTEQDVRRAADALAAAAHAWDVRAAALSGSVPAGAEAGAEAGADAGTGAGTGAGRDAGRDAGTGLSAGAFARLAAVVRGGLPEAGRDVPGAARAPRDRPVGPGEGAPVHGSAEWLGILDDLIFGRSRELLFVEFGPDRVNVIKAYLDENGIPRQKDAGSAEWDSLVPELDPHPEIRRFQLAGGIGGISPVGRRDFDAAVLRWLTESLPPPRDGSAMLLVSRPGWTLLDRAAATLRRTRPPRAELLRRCGDAYGATTADAVRGVLRTAPLPVDHSLLLARADRRTGAVDVHRHVLFPAGVRLRHGADATATVTVHGGVTGTSVLLPVLAGPPAGEDTGPAVLGVGRTDLGPLESARLTFVLRGPGEVALAGPGEGPRPADDGGGTEGRPPPGTTAPARNAPGATASDPTAFNPTASAPTASAPAAPGATAPGATAPAPTPLDPTPLDPTPLDLTALLTRLPRRIVRPPRLEVFCTVELSGADAAETEERLAFVRDLIASLARDPGTGGGLRVGAVGHYDHVIQENGYAPRPVLLMPPVPAGPAVAALRALDGWHPARRRQDTVSSLEDALTALVPLATAPPRAGEAVRRVALIVARRPPAPPGQHGMVPSCPLRADWRAELDRLRAAGVHVMTRADPRTGPTPPDRARAAVERYGATAWAELSRGGSFRPGADPAAVVAKALRPTWQWEGPPCPLAFASPLL
ncbi:hypothetical protein [Streptomyces sp. SPB4]|uniref:hypothetical protein n=1 Tax=Streptomyces sp. SPB4 TaxID=2940553 RepID=UPI002473964B|nr:hypothetical protein [Streptomyces sp. SPB4]